MLLSGCDSFRNSPDQDITEHESEESEEEVAADIGCAVDESMPVDLCSEMGEGWIFCDDFESDESLEERYFEYVDSNGSFTLADTVGRGGGRGMRTVFDEGQVTAGNLKLSFGRHEVDNADSKAVMNDQNFYEIYWHIDLCHAANWTGGGGHKLSRSTTLLDGWAQGHIGHIWDGGTNQYYLRMDPATGIDEEGNLVSTRYNDWENLRWIGAVNGTTPIFDSDSVGKWYSIEARVKLNTPGESDGIFEFWIDGVLQASRDDYNWHGSWNDDPNNYGINAIFLENYWNDPGSVQKQERYFDNFVVSTKRIGNLRDPMEK